MFSTFESKAGPYIKFLNQNPYFYLKTLDKGIERRIEYKQKPESL